jgi:2-keto-myo-inositol isomerase
MSPAKPSKITRRQFQKHCVVATAAASTVTCANSLFAANNEPSPFRYCLNTSTIQGEKIDIREQVKIAAEAGYDCIEIWLRDVERFTKSGGKIFELRHMIADAGITVESAIAFGSWIVNDDEARKKGLDQCRKDMEIVRELGGRRIAAPPAGATDGDKIELKRVAERYATLLDIGRAIEVVPQIEVWGFSKNLATLSDVLYVATEAHHPDACILPDVYHLYKGGSELTDLRMLEGQRVSVFHINDYPDIPRDKINDADRVYPGDGIAPLEYIFKTMRKNGFGGILSLELFNRQYWQQDPREVAKTGLAKMKSAMAAIES